jgi:large subunit ribosomal protein L15
MNLHDLREPYGTKHARKRRGRGIAAGQGKTAGRGTKGEGARAGTGGRLYFEGGQLPLVNRLPIRRGFNNVNRVAYNVINVQELNIFEAGSEIDVEILLAVGLAKGPLPIKILGGGEIDRPLTVAAHGFSASAAAKIQAAGGSISVIE